MSADAEEGASSSDPEDEEDVVRQNQSQHADADLSTVDNDERPTGAVHASVMDGKSVDESLFARDAEAFWLKTVPLPVRLRSRKRAFRTGFQNIDMRRTARVWVKTGRISLDYVRKPVYRRPERLDVLWDVSGSMADYISLYLPWLKRLVYLSNDVRVFPFGTRLEDVTDALRGSTVQVHAALADIRGLWAGGTSIGAAVQSYVNRFAHGRVGRHTTVLIISDGWDVGNPQDITQALHAIKQRDAKVFWMNPWFATPGFAAKTRALLAAKPFLERMVAGHNQQALQSLMLD